VALDDPALGTRLRNARTHNAFADQPVPDPMLRALYDLLK
jgi:hypothetical protein